MVESPTLSFSSSAQAIGEHAFAYRRCADQDARAEQPAHHPVVVVGAGPVGLTLAIDLAQRGQPVVLLDNDHRLSTGSRAICFAKRTLEIWDRLGVGDAACAKGVGWSVGKVYLRDDLVYRFDLQPEPGHERPAFINLQQYYAETYLVVRALQLPNLEIRWDHKVVDVAAGDLASNAPARLTVETPEGRYALAADHVVACDGSRSAMRAMMGLESQGRTFQDRFLIADVRMQADFPAERWFWFDPPFHPNQSVLLHRQPDGVWRIDFQLGWQADPEEEKTLERIKPRVDAMMRAAVGREVPFTLEWASVYTFACLRMQRFQHGRVLFAGDAAHGVSPFGARGANSGVQDADNLAWKLDAVVRGSAPSALLTSYALEREAAADENILNSTRATDFITPKSEVSRLFRDAALALARDHAFARRIVNSGRLSTPSTQTASPLNTPDVDAFTGLMVPGAPALDAPVGQGAWLLRQLGGPGFSLLVFGDEAQRARVQAIAGAIKVDPALQVVGVACEGLAAQRYDARPGTVYLLRPDQHVAARWRQLDAAALNRALQRALGQGARS
jgi:3-(3-hydroxy-phenyl)propionate hydroxylase